MNTEDKIKKIEILLAEVKAELKAKKIEIKLNTGESTLYGDGTIVQKNNIASMGDYKQVNNVWKTEEQANQARNIMSAVFELKQLCDIINEKWKPDFEDDDECKYYLGYDHVDYKFFMSSNFVGSYHSFYFSRDCLDKILPIMSDNLKAYIKGELQ
jgi:hypothetical protein